MHIIAYISRSEVDCSGGPRAGRGKDRGGHSCRRETKKGIVMIEKEGEKETEKEKKEWKKEWQKEWRVKGKGKLG